MSKPLEDFDPMPPKSLPISEQKIREIEKNILYQSQSTLWYSVCRHHPTALYFGEGVTCCLVLW